jgi:hypothetical protein
MVRGQWHADGRQVLLAYGQKDDALNLVLVPWKERTPVKSFHLTGLEDSATSLVLPLCVVGEQVFFKAGRSEVARLDLQSGEVTRRTLNDTNAESNLLADPSGKAVYYLESTETPTNAVVFGQLQLDTLAQLPLMVLTNELPEQMLLAFDPRGQRLALLESDSETNRVLILQPGKPAWTRLLHESGQRRTFGSVGFFPKGDRLWATFAKAPRESKTTTFGWLEIPLNEESVRETILIAAAPANDSEKALFFQGAISHDGNTAAVASTYVIVDQDKAVPSDACLFLVDLKSPGRKVTRVPALLPAPSSARKSR